MKTSLIFIAIVVITLLPSIGFSQSENVPVGHPVYEFLKRMEVKGWIARYHDAVLPLSRREVAGFLTALRTTYRKVNDADTITIPADGFYSEYGGHLPPLGLAEQDYLEWYYSEFAFDVGDPAASFTALFDNEGTRSGMYIDRFNDPHPKYLYAVADSDLTFFVNGLLNMEARRITGDAMGGTHTEFFQFGGRLRGNVYDRLGFYLQGTNSLFWGSRQLLQRDRHISQAYTLGITNTNSFDFVEGYVRYDGRVVSAQVGRERVLWGAGFEQKMILSDNVRVFDFLRADVQYKALKYTFIHAWLLGRKTQLTFSLPSDTSAKFYEPVVADKYIAAHRLEFSFPGAFDIGAQEMVIYSNRSPDLAFINPITLIESAQRSREERDNVFWAFDIQTRFIPGMELSGTFLLDDLNFPDLFSDLWTDRWALQASLFYADPFAIPNTTLILEYTRVEPYVFSHSRSRENDYGSFGSLLGARIGPNADSWLVRVDVLPHRNFTLSARVAIERHGENLDSLGLLPKNGNFGGDFLQPHRESDPATKVWLGGILFKTYRAQVLGSYEIMRQVWCDLSFEYELDKNITAGTQNKNITLAARLRLEL